MVPVPEIYNAPFAIYASLVPQEVNPEMGYLLVEADTSWSNIKILLLCCFTG